MFRKITKTKISIGGAMRTVYSNGYGIMKHKHFNDCCEAKTTYQIYNVMYYGDELMKNRTNKKFKYDLNTILDGDTVILNLLKEHDTRTFRELDKLIMNENLKELKYGGNYV